MVAESLRRTKLPAEAAAGGVRGRGGEMRRRRAAIGAAVALIAMTVGDDALPTAAPECALMPDPGSCKGFFRRFYYDRWTGVGCADEHCDGRCRCTDAADDSDVRCSSTVDARAWFPSVFLSNAKMPSAI